MANDCRSPCLSIVFPKKGLLADTVQNILANLEYRPIFGQKKKHVKIASLAIMTLNAKYSKKPSIENRISAVCVQSCEIKVYMSITVVASTFT